MPLQVICDMIGIPEQDRQKIFHWPNVILGASGPHVTADFEEFATASMDFAANSTAMAEDPFVHRQPESPSEHALQDTYHLQ